MTPYELIRKKQSGESLTRDELAFLINSYSSDSLPDYQMAAFLMAVYFQGLDEEETAVLIELMVRSGETIDLSGLPGIPVDKHSTGGVGDKISLILAPLVAAAGVNVPMISGRGLGHTGGTLDKLESIPGFQTAYTIENFKRQVESVGVCIMESNNRLVPADNKLYALRDVTATIKSIPLICGSIMSKKIAEGIRGLVLDVKTGSGAFLREYAESKALAERLVETGNRFGIDCRALITDMNQPLGYQVGNWNEVLESVECLRGDGPDDLMDVTFELGSHMVLLAGKAQNPEEARSTLQSLIASGEALEKFYAMVEAQGGETEIFEAPEEYPEGDYSREVRATGSGYVTAIDCYEVGMTSVGLGAGRQAKDDSVDPKAGITLHKKIGDPVESGEPLAVLSTDRGSVLDESETRLRDAYTIGSEPADPPTLIYEEIG